MFGEGGPLPVMAGEAESERGKEPLSSDSSITFYGTDCVCQLTLLVWTVPVMG